MELFKTGAIHIEESEVIRLLGYRDQAEPDEEIFESIREEIRNCKSYIEPVVYFERANIKSVDQNMVALDNGVVFEGDFITSRLSKCSSIIASITTLGEDIDKVIKNAFEEGDFLKGMVVDHIGTLAVDYVNKAFWTKLVDSLGNTNIGITSRLSPGDTAWDLSEQTKIFQVIGKDKVNVKLTESYLMKPIKSTSLVYGFGENIGVTKLGHICTECNMKHCAYRADNRVELTINKNGVKEIIDVKRGSNLLQVLRDNKTFIDTPCGGKGTCGKCKVKVIKGTEEANTYDIKHLSKEEINNGMRLACAIVVKGRMEVEIPDAAEGMTVLVNSEKQSKEVDPLVKKKYIVMDTPSIEDQRDDYKRLSDALGVHNLSVRYEDLPNLSSLLREANFSVTAAVYKNKLLHLEAGDSSSKFFGVAVDIGTTTIAVYLVDINNGNIVDVESQVNKQRRFGADVISRINYTIENENGLQAQKESILDQLNFMIDNLCERNHISCENIYDAAIVGNTTMIHLLLGLPCKNIAMAPYIPVITREMEFDAKEFGLNIKGMVSLVPGIASYVGSDITAGIISSGMVQTDKYSILLDLGTNGEIALGNCDGVVACSTAAGPAFEGANIKHGVGGIKGAVSKINLSESKVYETIGKGVPCGICGSGVLDALAELVKHGIVDETGRMVEEDEIEDSELSKRLIEDDMKEFLIAENSVSGHPITFTQRDVREVQLAKAAVCAGIKILIQEKNIEYKDIDKIYIGGGFGNYMNIDSALAIGLIPEELGQKVKSIGNCAGSGALAYLLSKNVRENASNIAGKASYIELSKRKDFQDYFIDSMML
jgi:uncharacterized 2Fe-2S/4Fe-4S cluster protein (DUF4445 family)